MARGIFVAGAALGLALGMAPAWGQASGPPGGIPTGGAVSNHLGRDTMTQEQFNKLQDYADQAKRLTKEDKAKGKTLKDLLAEDLANAQALAKAMPLACDVTEAFLAAQGPATVDGEPVDTKTYEVTCTNGMGYYLINRQPGTPYGFSCFAAEASHDADVAAGRTPSTPCRLPSNTDINFMASAAAKSAGITCAVARHKWIGRNAKAHTEFDEIACSDGRGYMLAVALPGSALPVRAETCRESGARGLACAMTDSGPPPLTLQALKGAIAQHKLACTAGDADMRVIGQENALKRYVVELRCVEQPKGLVAFVPLEGNTAPFEAVNCPAAAKRGIKCSLTAP